MKSIIFIPYKIFFAKIEFPLRAVPIKNGIGTNSYVQGSKKKNSFF